LSARSRHQDIDAARHGLNLRVLADATEDDGVGQRQIGAIGLEAVADLDRQFARRGQDQGAGALRNRPGAGSGKAVEDGQRKGRRLAGAGLGDAQQVTAFEQVRDGLRLDRGRSGVVLGADGAQDRLAQAEIAERRHCERIFRGLTARCRAALWC
jgi:hypothetical protein